MLKIVFSDFRFSDFRFYTNEKWRYLANSMHLTYERGKLPKINITKSKLETKEPRFHDQNSFSIVKTDHFEGSTVSGRMKNIQNKFILDAKLSENKNLFPVNRRKNFSLAFMIHF